MGFLMRIVAQLCINSATNPLFPPSVQADCYEIYALVPGLMREEVRGLDE